MVGSQTRLPPRQDPDRLWLIFVPLRLVVGAFRDLGVALAPGKPVAAIRGSLELFRFLDPLLCPESRIYARKVVFKEVVPVLADFGFALGAGRIFVLV